MRSIADAKHTDVFRAEYNADISSTKPIDLTRTEIEGAAGYRTLKMHRAEPSSSRWCCQEARSVARSSWLRDKAGTGGRVAAFDEGRLAQAD
jgi:hypothetical protein